MSAGIGLSDGRFVGVRFSGSGLFRFLISVLHLRSGFQQSVCQLRFGRSRRTVCHAAAVKLAGRMLRIGRVRFGLQFRLRFAEAKGA